MAIAKLSIDIEARLANFEKQLDKAAAAAESRAQKMSKAFDQVGTAVGSVVAGLSVGAFAAMVKNVSEVAEEVGRLSKLSGAGTEEFQRYAYAAQSVGFQADKMADVFKDVNDKIGDFLTTGGGPLKDFFDNIAPRVGVTAEAFKKLSGPEALQLYYDSLQKAGVSQKEMTFYMEAIANDATALAPLLANNGEEFKRLGDQAKRYGAIISDDLVQSSKEFNENLRVSQVLLSAMSKDIAGSAIPIFSAVAEEFQNVGDKADGMSVAGQVSKTILEALVVSGANVAFVLNQIGTALGGASARLGALATLDFKAFSTIGELMEEDFTAARKRLDDFEARIFDVAKKAPIAARQAFDGASSGRSALTTPAKGGKSAGDTVRGSFEDYDARILRQVASAITDNDVTRAQDWAAQIEKLDELFFDAGLSAEYYEAAMRKLTGQESSDGMKKQTEELTKQKSLTEELGLTFTSAFEDAVVGGKKFSEVLKGIEQDLLRLLTRKAITEPVASAVKDIPWGSLFGGLFGSSTPTTGGTFNGIRLNADGNVYSMPSLSAYSGTVVSQPTFFANGGNVMGEAGPEGIFPLKRGADGKLGIVAHGGSGDVTVIVNNNTDAQTRTEKRSDGRGGSIIEVVVEQAVNRVASNIASGNGAVPAALQSTYGLKRGPGAY